MQHMPGELKVIRSAVRKALNYLWVFSTNSKSAYKAWNILRPLFERALGQYRNDILSDVPKEAPEPRNWSDEDMIEVGEVTQTLR